jgi:hypothetical protein
MNNPYMPERDPVPLWKDGRVDRQWEPGPQGRAEACDLCRRPLYPGWVEVAAEDMVSTFTGRRYCSDRCLGRAAQRLPNEDDQAVAAIQNRLTRAQQDYREERRYVRKLEDQLDQVRRQWAELHKVYPGLQKGGVGPVPAGGVIRQHVRQLHTTVGKRVDRDD